MNTRTTQRRGAKMDPERWDRLKTIVTDALEEDSAHARTSLVDKHCGDDTDMRTEVESLLATAAELSQQPTDSFEDCATKAGDTLWQEDTSRFGQRVGAYAILRELGRGGMGAVYLGARDDGQFEKEVAIKVLKRGTDTEEVLRRFASERHILARLDHPNIARLLDAGTTADGLPYFVMEYVAGAPVTRFVRDHKLTIRERLEVFLKVCSAVEVAHGNHVVHRDLKPGNILVNAAGEPKLLDFGIAKLLGPGQECLEITAAGEERLTPNCASPEQTDGRPVTEASDVYALGALLYELLSEQKPHKFRSAQPTREEIVRVIREDEPAPPSAVVAERAKARLLRGDLDAIVQFAMRKDPASRYATVSAFAADVRRHLAHEPVLARRGSTGYRARSFVSRHRLALRFAATALVAAAAAFALLKNRPTASSAASSVAGTPASLPPKSIAVLPFDNFGGENPSYFADGVQDNILTDLGKVGDLMVVSRNAVAGYRGKGRNAREIGRDLGVANVLVGSVQKSGERIRINAQLIDTRSDTQIWAEHYDRSMDDLFALQSELAQTIVTQLKAKLSSGEQEAIWKRPTEDMQAYDLYLRARATFAAAPGPDPSREWNAIVKLMQEAIARDPKFTRAYCLLNEVQLLIYRYGNDHSPELLAAARDAAETALRLEPDLEEARLALARYFYNGLNDYRRTEEELSKVPASAAHTVEFFTIASLVERRLAKWEESIRDGERAVELDPQNQELAVNLAQTYNGLRRYADTNRIVDAAIARARGAAPPRLVLVKEEAAVAIGDLGAARAALDVYSDWQGMDYQNARLWVSILERDYAQARRVAEATVPEGKEMPSFPLMMGLIAEAEGQPEEAQRAFEQSKVLGERAAALRPADAETKADLGVINAKLGRKEEALALAQSAVESCPPAVDALVAPMCQLRLAEVLIETGERDAAFEALARLVRMPFGISFGDLKFNPMWDTMRDDPRFEQLLAEARLTL